MSIPLQEMVDHWNSNRLIRFYRKFESQFAHEHMKELPIEDVGTHREMQALGQSAINFGFDSFLGLDQDRRVQEAVWKGALEWGTQFGASRAFAVPTLERDVEQQIASWMQTEAAAVFPSVTLANCGILPGLVTTGDVLVLDEFAHNSMQEGAKIAAANGVKVLRFAHNSASDLDRVLTEAGPFRGGLIAVDGVYSMSGVIAAMPELDAVARRHNCALYVDDAHATAVLGEQGRGTVLEHLGSYDNVITVGCFSKACSTFGAFAAGSKELIRLIKMRSNTYIFGGPVPPPYLKAVSTVINILQSAEYPALQQRLHSNIARLVGGLRGLGLTVTGGISPIITVFIGDEPTAMRSGRFLFDEGYYVQSVAFPAVPYHCAVLRIQVNANHTKAAIDGLIDACERLTQLIGVPSRESVHGTDTAAAPVRKAA